MTERRRFRLDHPRSLTRCREEVASQLLQVYAKSYIHYEDLLTDCIQCAVIPFYWGCEAMKDANGESKGLRPDHPTSLTLFLG